MNLRGLTLLIIMLPSPLIGSPPPFFAMSYGLPDHDPIGRVVWLNSQGYDGIAMAVWNDALFEELRATIASAPVAEGRFRVFGNCFPFDLENPRHRGLASATIKAGAAVGAPLWLTVKPVDAPGSVVLALIRDLCDEAAAVGMDVVLYPHDMTWFQDVEASLELLAKVGKPNLFTSLHLHQELRAGNADRLPAVIAAAAPFTKLVSISGAGRPDEFTAGSRDWSDVVRPLGETKFSVEQFYRLLRAQGYSGPVGLQNWRLAGDLEAHHVDAVSIWRSWHASDRD